MFRKTNFLYLLNLLKPLDKYFSFAGFEKKADPSWFGFPILIKDNNIQLIQNINLFGIVALNVKKYKDYGWTMTGGEETDKIINRFYWSVYELNNGEVIVQQKIEDWEGNRLMKTYFQYNYANHELKNGKKIIYDFDQDFNNLFDS